MPEDSHHIRTVIYDKEVAQAIDSEQENFFRLNDVIAAIEWLLARTPEVGVPIPETTDPTYYLIGTEAMGIFEVPAVTVLYHFDDQTVTFYGIRISASL